jgi:outer membrane lipopolysaccharide assembly protein LptE/RlpB
MDPSTRSTVKPATWLARGAALAILLSSACGYNFAGTGSRVPEDVKTVSLGPIQNETRELGIEKALLESLEDEVSSRPRLKVVPIGQGEATLSGIVRYYIARPTSFSSQDEALEYQVTMAVDLELRRTDNGKLLWKGVNVRESQSYSAVPGVVVTTSSQFQRTTLNAQNVNQFTDIQLSEGQRREANERLVELLSRDIYNQMMEDF